MLLNLYSVPKCPCNVKSVYILTTLTCIHIFQTDWIPKKTKKNGNIVCLNWKKKKRICDLGANTIAFYQVAMSRWKKSNKSTFTNQEQVAVAPQLGIFNNWKRDTVGADWGKKRYIDYRIDELTQEGEREKETHWEKEGLYG